jgi:hypothetical protein
MVVLGLAGDIERVLLRPGISAAVLTVSVVGVLSGLGA